MAVSLICPGCETGCGFCRALPAVTVTVPVRTVSEANVRDHWRDRAKRTKRARRWAYALAPAVPLPAIVRLVRLSPGTLDDDNLRAALKAVRDGVADRLTGGNDRDPRVEWRYDQKTCKRGQFGVRIEIMPKGKEGG